MICPGCSKEIPNDSIKCPECGLYVLFAKKHKKKCPYCKEDIETEASFCRFCKKDLTKDSRSWYEKKRIIFPMLILEIIIVGLIVMTIKDFGSTIEKLQYRNNRLEIVGKLSEALDSFNQIDSLQHFMLTENKDIEIKFLIFTYDKRSLQLASYSILKKISPSIKKEGTRIKSIKIIAETPTGGRFTCINSIGDIIRIENGTWDFPMWLTNTQTFERDLF
jgi:predicted nucleic acid-binding Zn ribbon protein